MSRGRGKDRGRPPGSPDVSEALVANPQQQQVLFQRWVEPEIETLLRVARTLTGSWSDAEDVVQETLIRAYRAIEGFDGRHPRAWLFTILRRTHLNSIRRQRPVYVEDDELSAHRPAFGADRSPSPEQLVDDQQLDADIHEALMSLDERFRRVVLLVDVDRLTYAETAELLGVPVGTVMSRLSRARSRLRAHLPHRRPQSNDQTSSEDRS